MKRGKPYYEALGVAKDATHAEVKKAYRALAKRLHPDRLRDPEHARRAEERLKEINAAWSDYLSHSRPTPSARRAAHRSGPRRSPSERDDEDAVSEQAQEAATGGERWRAGGTSRDRYRAERARAARERDERERRAREAAERVRRFILAGFAGVCLVLLVAVLLLLAVTR
jgi:curved DNA-binding protein CbpA